MSVYIKDRKNGSIIQYSEMPLTLPNGESVLFRIDSIFQADGVAEEEMVSFFNSVENRIDSEVLKKTGAQGIFPHFYISCPYSHEADLMIKAYKMSYVEEMGIMLYPSNEEFSFHGSWMEYKHMKLSRNDRVLVVNAEGTDEDRSMIQHWIDNTNYGFHVAPYMCPATGDVLDRDGLDGAHVEIVDHPEMGQFITPVQKEFNRSHSRRSFYVKPEYLVPAP